MERRCNRSFDLGIYLLSIKRIMDFVTYPVQLDSQTGVNSNFSRSVNQIVFCVCFFMGGFFQNFNYSSFLRLGGILKIDGRMISIRLLPISTLPSTFCPVLVCSTTSSLSCWCCCPRFCRLFLASSTFSRKLSLASVSTRESSDTSSPFMFGTSAGGKT